MGQDTAFPKARFSSSVTINVSRAKKSEAQGWSYDKKERVSFKVMLKNTSPSLSFDGMAVEFYLLSQSMKDTKAFKLVQAEKSTASLAPLKEWSMESPEYVSTWSPDFNWGYKYKGWVLRILDPQGNLIVEKTSTSFFTNTDLLPSLKAGNYYTKDLKPTANPYESDM